MEHDEPPSALSGASRPTLSPRYPPSGAPRSRRRDCDPTEEVEEEENEEKEEEEVDDKEEEGETSSLPLANLPP